MGWIQAFWYRGTLICEKLTEMIDLVIGYKKAKRFYNGHQQSDFDDKSKIGIDRKYIHFCASRYYLTFDVQNGSTRVVSSAAGY